MQYNHKKKSSLCSESVQFEVESSKRYLNIVPEQHKPGLTSLSLKEKATFSTDTTCLVVVCWPWSATNPHTQNRTGRKQDEEG